MSKKRKYTKAEKIDALYWIYYSPFKKEGWKGDELVSFEYHENLYECPECKYLYDRKMFWFKTPENFDWITEEWVQWIWGFPLLSYIGRGNWGGINPFTLEHKCKLCMDWDTNKQDDYVTRKIFGL